MSTRLLPGIQRGAIAVELDLERPRIIFFDHAATWLLVQRYGSQFIPELYEVTKDPRKLELKSMDALAYFLWAGLQLDAKETGDAFSLQDAEAQLTPMHYIRAFNGVVLALSGSMGRPVMPGKTVAISAAAAPTVDGQPSEPETRKAASAKRPQDPGPTRIMTSTSTRGSQSPPSVGRRSVSGR